ncbi:MAG: mechanosensitive ion channel family protein [Desulfuromonadaceae bacterium]|nr:mechanosensitive ion channel family protein [Desulfuromonadaceae bacterium]
MAELLSSFWANHSATLVSIGYKAVLGIVILIVSVVVAKGVRRAIQRLHDRLEKLDTTLVPILCTTATYAVYTIGGVFILDIFGVNTTSIIALLGAAGLAIGFALKDTLSNIAAGIMLLFLRPFRAGNFVEFGSVTGTVREVNLFTTILETFDGLYVSAPNSVIWGNNITNFTRNGKRRLDIVIGIAYSDPIDAGLDVLKKIISSEQRFLQTPVPQTMVASMGDSAVNLQLRGWTTIDDYWQTRWDLNKRVKEEIEAAGLSIPFPQRSVHVVANVANIEVADSGA